MQNSPIFFQICRLVQGATQASPSPGVRFPLVQRHTWQPIKGHATVQVRRGPQNKRQVTNNSQISLSIQLDQTITNSERLKNKFTKTLTVSEASLNQNQWSFCAALRDSIESSSSSYDSCNSSAKSIARSDESDAITETLRSRRRRGKEFQRFRTG